MSARARLLLSPLLCVVSLTACNKAQQGGGAPSGSAAAEAPDSVRPPDDRQLPTTGGRIAFANLEAQIQGAEAAIARSPTEIDTRLKLIELLSMRAVYRARIADRERALSLAEAVVHDAPARHEGYLARSSARAALHLFPDALADLDEAQKHGASPSQLLSPRASILQAQGKLDEAWKLRRAAREASKSLTTLGAEAALLGEMRRFEEAERLYGQATLSYRDVSPFPVAWLFFQAGLTWQRAGKTERARAFYTAALARLPEYAHAASHLALLEAPAQGVSRLEPIVAASDDPELEMILAQRLRDRGDSAEAERRLAHVRARFDELCAKHPEAFADHAGWFWLDEGHDPQRALTLAKQNLALRKTEKAYELGLLAATAAGSRADLCAIGPEAQKLRYSGEMLRTIAASACDAR